MLPQFCCRSAANKHCCLDNTYICGHVTLQETDCTMNSVLCSFTGDISNRITKSCFYDVSGHSWCLALTGGTITGSTIHDHYVWVNNSQPYVYGRELLTSCCRRPAEPLCRVRGVVGAVSVIFGASVSRLCTQRRRIGGYLAIGDYLASRIRGVQWLHGK